METDARSGASGGWRQRWARRAGPALRRAAKGSDARARLPGRYNLYVW